MANFLFCLIFLQVSIFFITGFVLLATFLFSRKDRNSGRSTNRGPVRQRQQAFAIAPVAAEAETSFQEAV